jgi:hypothetical protein
MQKKLVERPNNVAPRQGRSFVLGVGAVPSDVNESVAAVFCSNRPAVPVVTNGLNL